MGQYKKIHMIGIGGIGMSALARLYLHEKKAVSGSDKTVTPITQELEALGVIFTSGHAPANVPDDADLVVYSDAVKEDNAERIRAVELGIPQKQYFEALGEIANEYYLIAVSGTHGKTTTTAMLIDILEEASYDPTAIVGSLRVKTGSNFRPGKSKYFIVEADEYRRHFQYLDPDVLVITNIEFDHPDYFTSLSDVQNAFHALAKKVPEEGAVIAQVGDPAVSGALEGVKARIIDYKSSIDIGLMLPQPGLHNQLNAAAARAVCQFIGIEEKYIHDALENFAGTARRFEYKGECNGAVVYDDYAHHPTEIAAAIAGAKERHPLLRLTVVFQPHTYSRTKELCNDFAKALSKADRIILAPIYAAREQNESGISSDMLATEIAKTNSNVKLIEAFEDIIANTKQTVDENDVVVVMGAGDISTVANKLAKK